MAGTIIVDRIESDASYASSINVAAQVTFSNTVNFGVSSVAPTAGVYSPSANNLAFTTASTERMRVTAAGNFGVGTASPQARIHSTKDGAELARFTNSGSNGGDWEFKIGGGGFEDRKLMITDKYGGADNVRVGIDSSGNFQFNSGYGSAATAYGCRAWVNFNSIGTVSIYGSGNCSSITDDGVGKFTFNFTTAMPDINYSVVTGPTQSNSNNNGAVMNVFLSAMGTYSAPLVGSFKIVNYHGINSALGDSSYNCVAVFR